MEIGSILMILAVVVLVSLYVSLPFSNRPAKTAPLSAIAVEAEHSRSSLLAEYDRLLTTLQDLDFDNLMGKVPAEEYPQQRASLLQTAATVLGQLDELQPAVGQNGVEDRIEAAIAARRAAHAPGASGDDLEALIAARRRTRSEKAAGFCHACGKPVQKSDKFCPKCGATLA
jgi:hypothetical protein